MNDMNYKYVKVRETKRRYEDILLLKKGVIGCGIGLDEQGEPGIIVYISGEHDIPPKIDSVEVLTERVQPDEKWTKEGHITAASIQDLDKITRQKLTVKSRLQNKVDAAIGKPNSLDLVVPEILGLGIPKGSREAHIGMRLIKSGRTTGVSDGVVQALDVSLFVDYSSMGYETALFVEQIATTPMAEPGDSGSLVMDTDLNAVGLLFAQTTNFTFHNRIQNVLEALDVEIYTDRPNPKLRKEIMKINQKLRNGKKRTERWRPVPMGVSIGLHKGGTGTAGCLVKDRKTGEILMLSNAHVLAMPIR